MDEAEKLKRSPASGAEIWVVICEMNESKTDIKKPFLDQPEFLSQLQNLYREDLFYSDIGFTAWTTKG